MDYFARFEATHDLGDNADDFLHPDVCRSRHAWSEQEVCDYISKHIAYVATPNAFIHKTRNIDGLPVTFELKTRDQVRVFLEAFEFPQPPNEDGDPQPPLRGTLYLSSGRRLTYAHLVFDPSDPEPRTGVRRDIYLHSLNRVFNMFPGFRFRYRENFEIEEEKLQRFLYHTKYIICNRDERLFDFLMQWLAHLVQVPERKPQCGLLLRSIEGTGKDVFCTIIKQMLGMHLVGTVENEHRIDTRFNEGYSFKLLVLCNEVTYGKSHRIPNHLKTLITDDRMSMERKGLPVTTIKSCERWILLSNEEHPIPVSRTDRRYACMEVSPARVGDHDYFNELAAAYTEGDASGLEHLYHYLMRIDLNDRVRILPPMTGLKRRLQDLTDPLPVEYEFFHDMGRREEVCEDWDDYEGMYMTTTTFVALLRRWAAANNIDRRIPGQKKLGAALKHVLGRSVSPPNGHYPVRLNGEYPHPRNKAYLVDYTKLANATPPNEFD